MLLVTQTDMLGRYFGDIKAVEMIADAGFDAIDYSMFEIWDNGVFDSDGYLDYINQIKAAADAKGITFAQAHALAVYDVYGRDYFHFFVYVPARI